MDIAIVKGRLTSACEFLISGVKEQEGHAGKCTYCGSRVFFYGTSTTNTEEHFSHEHGSDPECPARKERKVSLIALGDKNAEENVRLRAMAETNHSYRVVIQKIWNASSRGAIKAGFDAELEFRLKRANREKVFFYAGLTEDNLPYVLLTLTDLVTIIRGNDMRLRYRFRKTRDMSTLRPHAAKTHTVVPYLVPNGKGKPKLFTSVPPIVID